MILDQQNIARIRSALKFHPRGMNISEIAQNLKLNRNSVAKYLEILMISGQVEAKPQGTSKVYTLSQRVPVSAMMDFSSDMIVMIDQDGRIIQANDLFLKFAGLSREQLIGEILSRNLPGLLPGPSGRGDPERMRERKSPKSWKKRPFLAGKKFSLKSKFFQPFLMTGVKGSRSSLRILPNVRQTSVRA